VARVSKPTLIK